MADGNAEAGYIQGTTGAPSDPGPMAA